MGLDKILKTLRFLHTGLQIAEVNSIIFSAKLYFNKLISSLYVALAGQMVEV